MTLNYTHSPQGRTLLDERSVLPRYQYLYNTEQTQETNIYDPGEIRTRNPNKRAAADRHLRPHGNWDRLTMNTSWRTLVSSLTVMPTLHGFFVN